MVDNKNQMNLFVRLSCVILFSLLLLCRAFDAFGVTNSSLPSGSAKGCAQDGWLVLSAAYSPYSVHVIKSEVSGRIVRINAKEGQILKAGIPVMEVDSLAQKAELMQLKQVLSSLKKSEKVLARDLELTRKKYQRYLALKKKEHVEDQAVENMEQELHRSELQLIENRRQQADVQRTIIDMEDYIEKCAPCFPRDFYVAENFKELFETVTPGERITRLLDVSQAKVHMVLAAECFAAFEKRLGPEEPVHLRLVTEDGRNFSRLGRIEKLKIDPDNTYLYSYGFDLVFKPVPEILWGQVVKVYLDVKNHEVPGKTAGKGPALIHP
ncbi:MAG: hypothetical protein DSZ23_03875 [Thermodesulfatator sp.]|nr:MAG: hypothetical protein DSZ23_03875 [Thermodesulfatator sp.]